MLNWISEHYISIIVLVVVLVFGRGWIAKLMKGSRNTGSFATAFCNKCGWKGRVQNGKGACGRCGSLKLTLRTN